jgi:predicted dehydrogenase
MNRIRIAVIGVGHLGQAHARILAELPEAELVGVVDTNHDQAERVAERWNTTAFKDYRNLFGRIDAVTVVTPTIHHCDVTCAFLREGIPVLVEKPIAISLDEADEMISLAEEKNLPFQVGHIERFNPAFESLIQRRIQPKFIEAERHGPFTGRSTDIGAVLDLMIHDLDLLLALVGGPVRHVEAMGMTVFGGHEDVVNARLIFKSGCIAHVTVSRASQQPKRRLRVWAPEGYAGIDFVARKLLLVQPSEELRQRGIPVATMTPEERAQLKDQVFGRYLQTLEIDCQHVDQLTNELKHFIKCVQTGRTPRVTGADGREALDLAHRILECVRNHSWSGTSNALVGPENLPAPMGRLFNDNSLREAA